MDSNNVPPHGGNGKDTMEMKKGFFRPASFLFALLFLLTSVLACAEKPEPVGLDDTLPSSTEETEELIHADLPEMDMEGYTFSVYHWTLSGNAALYNDFYSEELDGDPINDAVYERNTRLQQQYNFEIDYAEDEYNIIRSNVTAVNRSNDDVYDLVLVRLADVSTNVLEGDFLDFYSDIPYVNFDKPYWDQDLCREMSFLDHLYLADSALSNEDVQETLSILFNKTMARDRNFPDFYEAVRHKEWTIDRLYEIVNGWEGDLNGDGNMSVNDDEYAMISGDFAIMSLFNGCGGTFATKDDDGYPEFTFPTEENYEITELIRDIMTHTNYANCDTSKESFDRVTMFGNNRSLFFSYSVKSIVALRGEEGIDFGILPTPLYDETQDHYSSYISKHGMGMFSVLRPEQDPDKIGFLLEALSAGSYYDLKKAYYDITLKTKMSRDDESQEMLDLIFEHRRIDWADVYDFSLFVSAYLRQLSRTPEKSIITIYASYENLIEQKMEEFYSTVERLDAE